MSLMIDFAGDETWKDRALVDFLFSVLVKQISGCF